MISLKYIMDTEKMNVIYKKCLQTLNSLLFSRVDKLSINVKKGVTSINQLDTWDRKSKDINSSRHSFTMIV